VTMSAGRLTRVQSPQLDMSQITDNIIAYRGKPLVSKLPP